MQNGQAFETVENVQAKSGGLALAFDWRASLKIGGWSAVRRKFAEMAIQHSEVLGREAKRALRYPDQFPRLGLLYFIYQQNLAALYLSLHDPEVAADPTAVADTEIAIEFGEDGLRRMRAKALKLKEWGKRPMTASAIDKLIANAQKHFAIDNHEQQVADFRARTQWFPSTLPNGRGATSPLGGTAREAEPKPQPKQQQKARADWW
jgi:hypothetical protein